MPPAPPCRSPTPLPAAGLTFAIPRVRNADDSNILGQVSTTLTAWTAAVLIAARLGISPETVNVHLRRIYVKLHVHSRTEATLKYLQSRGPPGP